MRRLTATLTFIALLICAVPFYAQSPCSGEGYRQFDFWVGAWEVYHAQADTIVGRNHIKSILNGCVIEENWTGANGFAGKSFNTYNPADSTWNQVWVDVAGNTYHFSGKYEDKVMRMAGETLNAKGQKVIFEMSYHYNPDEDTVRQIWKQSQDGGAQWQTIFDGLYRKK